MLPFDESAGNRKIHPLKSLLAHLQTHEFDAKNDKNNQNSAFLLRFNKTITNRGGRTLLIIAVILKIVLFSYLLQNLRKTYTCLSLKKEIQIKLD